ncbi:MAG: carboxypeptidase regulatory-like domain-containing protein [Holophaga sp.]|nr:carboxypeptidase regulatory-like domain-containing protein [Holophaga sp.]
MAPSWVAYDSTYSYDFSAFPGGSWVKEADLIPQPVMGAASVCAANRIYALGGNTNRVNYAVNQYMDTGLQCHYGVNSVPWLSILPTTGSLPGGQSSQTRINLGLNAADPSIFQPGSYFANLIVGSDTIFGAGIVPITMTVQAPASWGKLTGVVQNMGYCAASPSLLNQAQVLLEASSGLTATLTTNAQGVYTYWLDQAAQPVTVTVTYTGLQSTTISGLGLSAGQVTNQNIALHPAIPCAQPALTQINADVITGQSLQIPLNLANNGHASLAWELFEIPGQTGAGLGPVLPLEAKSSRPSPAGYSAGLYQPFDPNLALLQEGFESGSMPPAVGRMSQPTLCGPGASRKLRWLTAGLTAPTCPGTTARTRVAPQPELQRHWLAARPATSRSP